MDDRRNELEKRRSSLASRYAHLDYEVKQLIGEQERLPEETLHGRRGFLGGLIHVARRGRELRNRIRAKRADLERTGEELRECHREINRLGPEDPPR